jgi:hypothetical protein
MDQRFVLFSSSFFLFTIFPVLSLLIVKHIDLFSSFVFSRFVRCLLAYRYDASVMVVSFIVVRLAKVLAWRKGPPSVSLF